MGDKSPRSKDKNLKQGKSKKERAEAKKSKKIKLLLPAVKKD